MLSANLYKKNRYFFTASEVEIDKGWIFEDTMTSSVITYDSSNFDIDERPDLTNDNMDVSSAIFSFTPCFMKNHDKYSMSFMKIQDLAAQVGGFMKIVMVFCFVLNYHKNQFDRDVEVINKLFEFEKENKEVLNVSKFIRNQNQSQSNLADLLSKKTCK